MRVFQQSAFETHRLYWGLGLFLIWALVPMNTFSQVKVGALLPLTGEVSVLGETALVTIQLAKKHYESVFEGEEIDVVVRDTEANPQVALQQMQELHQDGIRAFVGPFLSMCVEEIQSYANENELLVISPSSTSMALAQNDMVYRLIANDQYNIHAYLTYFDNQDIDSIALLYRDDIYGNTYVETIRSLAEEYGITIVGQVPYQVGTSEYQESIQELSALVQSGIDTSGAEKTVVLAISLDELGPIMKDASLVETLSQVHWFSSESSEHIDEFYTDTSVAAFADQTRFTFGTVSAQNFYHPIYPHNHDFSLALAQVEESMNSAPQDNLVAYIYDAFCLAVQSEKLADSVGGLKLAIEQASQTLIGLSLYIFFDENGDRDNGVISFKRFSLTDGGHTLVLTASYSKDAGDFGIYNPFYYYEYDIDDSDRTITVGALLSLTGSNATMGQSIEKTLEMVKQDITDYLKREFTENSEFNIIVTDTNSDPQIALEKLQELHQQGINAFIGPLSSAEISMVAEYANENNIFLLSPSSTSLELAQDDMVFRFALDNGKLSNAAAAFIAGEDIDYIQPVYRNDIYGADIYQAIKTNVESLGLVCGEGIAYEPTVSDFSDVVTLLGESIATANATYGADKTSVLMISFDEAIDLLNTISPQSSLRDVRWFGSDGLALNSMILDDPEARQFAVDTEFTAFGPGNVSYIPFDIYGHVIRNTLRDYIGKQPGAYDYLAHDAAWQFALFAVKQTLLGSDGVDLKELFVDLASSVKVGFQIYALNEFGDSTFGYCEFYTVVMNDQIPSWNHVAKYTYHIAYEGLDYLQAEDPVTSLIDWSIY
jgi:branched-chain amino acid transport system substrate-binding protein